MATKNKGIRRFGPYIILDRVGDGGMAEIFLAKMQGYSGFEKLIALKKIHPKFSRNQTFAQMLIHEAKLAANLQHFNVVQVLDLGEIDRQVFIAMEYVRGRDLAAVLSNTYRRKEKLPLNLSLCIATEFMTGLDYAHRMTNAAGTPLGIIHRDISPQNLLISYEGEVKVTDFGIARVISEKDGFSLPGNLHGKFGYMSPEQVMNKEIDQRSDIFSAGVVLWEMLTGTRLFRSKDQRKTIQMILSQPIPPPSSIHEEVPPSVDRICAKALARDRNLRYQTMGALLGELSRVADTLPRRAATRDLSVYMRRQFGNSGSAGSYAPRISTGSATPSHSGFDQAMPTGLSQVSGFSAVGQSDRVPLGQIVLEQGSIKVSDLEIALAEQRARGGRIGELLVASGTISEDELVRALSAQSGYRSISEQDMLALSPPVKLLKRFPKEAASSTLIVPISLNEEQRRVSLAVHDPYDDRAILETKVVLGVNDVDVFLAKRSSVRAAISRWYGEDEEEALAPEPIFAPETPEPPKSRPGVLFADSDLAALQTLIERIREEDCDLYLAKDGKEAREICRQYAPSVAFLEASLPKIDGYNILLELRSKNDEAAVFITSKRGDEFRQAKALELGADDFLVKPLRLEITTSKIRREIQKRAAGRTQLAPKVEFDGVSGTLKDMTALDIIQSLELGKKTAHTVLQYEDGRNGELNIQNGNIKGAIAGNLLGEEAFYLLMSPGPGLFRIEYRRSPSGENITKPNTFMMIEAMRRLDEENRVAPPISTADMLVPVPEGVRPSAPRNPSSSILPAPIVPQKRQVQSPKTPPPTQKHGPPVHQRPPADLSALANDLVLDPPGTLMSLDEFPTIKPE